MCDGPADGVNSIVLGWIGTVCSQTPEKRALALAMATTWSNTSFIWTPYLFPTSDEPRCVSSLLFLSAADGGADDATRGAGTSSRWRAWPRSRPRRPRAGT